jgi:PAS domain S-box-containing protein
MIDKSKTKQELIKELASLRQRIMELEKSDSERKRTEEALQESEEKFRKLADSTWEGIFIHREGIILDVNKSILKMSGYTAEEVIGQSVAMLLAPESIESALKMVRENIYSSELYFEAEGLRKDKTVIPLEALGKPIKYKNLDARVVAVRDVTNRKQAEEILRESEGKYLQLAEMLQEGIWMLDINGITTYANPCMTEMLGYSADEILERPIFAFSNEKNTESLSQHIKKRKLGLTEHYDLEFIRKDGKHIFTSLSASPLKDRRGEYAGSLISVTDITARKHAEDLYKTLAEKSFAGVYVIQGGIIKYINEICISYSGYTVDDLVGKNVLDIIHPQDRKATREKATEMLRGKRRAPYEFRIVTKDGNVRWIMETVNPIVYDGKLAALCNCMDITDFKDVERKVEEHELLESAILDTIPTAVLGLQDRRIIFANKAAESVFGWTPKELIGRETRMLYRNDCEYDQIGQTIYSSLGGNNYCQMEISCRKKDGEEFLCQFYTTSIGGHLSEGRIIAFYEDITGKRKEEKERVLLEKQLSQAQKMEAIGTLAGGIAHDFNNILGAIIGNTEMALLDVESNTRIEKYLKRVFSASERATDLVKQILTFSRQHEKEMRPLKMTPLIKEVMKLLRASLPSSIRIKQEITAYPDVILADPTQIHQVIMNLSTNAAHAMRESGGTLDIRLTNLDAKSCNLGTYPGLTPMAYLELTISDTGHGMEPAVQERIFDPFFTTKAHGEGTGLGLSVVHGIVKYHNGSIKVESVPGKGTAFHIIIPALQNEGEAFVAEKRDQVPRGTERILFVDDEEPLIQLAEEMLSSLGYKVIGMTDSLEVLDLINKRADLFDIVITDQTMPNLTGKELAKKIIGIRPDIPIILCTGLPKEKTSDNEEFSGIREYLSKPISRRTLAEAVRRVLDQKEKSKINN